MEAMALEHRLSEQQNVAKTEQMREEEEKEREKRIHQKEKVCSWLTLEVGE